MVKNYYETIKMKSVALKKLIYHSLIFSGEDAEFRMVMGLLGGEIKNEQVIITKSFAMISDSHHEAQWQDQDYIRMSVYDDELAQDGLFVVGWYCSIPNEGNFFNKTNRTTQHGYQNSNPKAIAIVIEPEEFLSKDFEEIVKIYRVKEIYSSDFSRENWIEHKLELIDQEKNSFLDEIDDHYNELIDNINENDKSNEVLNEYLDNWINRNL